MAKFDIFNLQQSLDKVNKKIALSFIYFALYFLHLSDISSEIWKKYEAKSIKNSIKRLSLMNFLCNLLYFRIYKKRHSDSI